MIASEVDKFQRKVIKDMIVSLSKNQFMLRELEQNNIFLNQIEQKMLEKLEDSRNLFKRLTLGYNEIEKEMLSRSATVDEIIYNERKIRQNSQSRSLKGSQQASESLNDDLECYAGSNSSHLQSPPPKIVLGQPEGEDQSPQNSDLSDQKNLKRKALSDFSFEDLSQMDVAHADTLKRLRENAQIHILGTYDQQSKKHDFKRDITEIMLDNVFIKVEGIAKEIFLKRLCCVSKKRPHH